MSKKTSSLAVYYVRQQIGRGAGYLTLRVSPTRRSGIYRWAKETKEIAVPLSYDAARKAAKRYGGNVVRRTYVITEQTI
jgi:hypothetical protein